MCKSENYTSRHASLTQYERLTCGTQFLSGVNYDLLWNWRALISSLRVEDQRNRKFHFSLQQLMYVLSVVALLVISYLIIDYFYFFFIFFIK
jgi:hypothetical protein